MKRSPRNSPSAARGSAVRTSTIHPKVECGWCGQDDSRKPTATTIERKTHAPRIVVSLRKVKGVPSNGELERPPAAYDRAPCAHNRSGVHGAPLPLSRPLQASVRARLAIRTPVTLTRNPVVIPIHLHVGTIVEKILRLGA